MSDSSSTPILGTIRASAWGGFFDCPMRFYYTNILGLRIPSSGAAALGTAIHHGTAHFDAARLNGDEVTVDEAVDQSIDAVKNPAEEVLWDDDLFQTDAQKLAAILTAKYCIEVGSERRYAAVELACDALDIGTEHGVIRVTGTTDRIRILPDGRKGISDFKSGKTATRKNADGTRSANTAAHHLQLGIYTMMAEQASGEVLDAPAEIIGLQTTKEAPVATGEVEDVRTALLGNDEHPGVITLAAKMLKNGTFPPNPKSMMCSGKYCAGHSRCIYKA